MTRFSGPPGAVAPDPSVLEGVTIPPFARLPDPAHLFSARAARFHSLGEASELKPYLSFLRDFSALQHDVASGLPEPDLPDADAIARAHAHQMPPLDRSRFTADGACEATFDRLLAAARTLDKPARAEASLARVIAAAPDLRDAMIRNVLTDSIPADALAEHVFVAGALQVHFARLASRLDPGRLVPVGDGACPCCGGPPVASMIVDWPNAHGARYCVCALCATWWNYVRVRCTACGATKGIAYQEMDHSGGTVKAETCDSCHSYCKVMYLAQDHALDPVADDVATLGLDILMRSGPYRRSAFNPLLLGY